MNLRRDSAACDWSRRVYSCAPSVANPFVQSEVSDAPRGVPARPMVNDWGRDLRGFLGTCVTESGRGIQVRGEALMDMFLSVHSTLPLKSTVGVLTANHVQTGLHHLDKLHPTEHSCCFRQISFMYKMLSYEEKRRDGCQVTVMDVNSRCNSSFSTIFCLTDSDSSSPLAVIIIPSLLASTTVLVVLILLYSLYKNKKRQRTSGQFTDWTMDLSGDSGVHPKVHPLLGHWEMPPDCSLEGVNFWQKGHYGPICKGTLRRKDGSSQPVVIKSLTDNPDKPESAEFVELVLFHSRVCRHQNVVKMLFCQSSRLPMFLILEQSSPGNLLHFLWTLRNNNVTLTDQDFTERSVFVVAKQVAAGLDYLVSEHRLVHGDVAARNILLGPGLSARVRAESALTSRITEVPLKWQAPERIMMQLSIDRSDVWSFGILMYEMITLGSPPYPELEPVSVLPKLQKSYRMKRPNNCGASLYDLMKYCWMWSFKDRPSYSAIIRLLDSSLYLASTHPICVPNTVDRSHYNTVAGITT
ncbi:hypothetical protein WMY93_028030 [Mugilogobius chulae]|uniref:Protein kinase domain-containing protein n=1 Tax=Mugilogobius chulae TaxID=88201 RepID=A0AAW0N6H7_9GOBI